MLATGKTILKHPLLRSGYWMMGSGVVQGAAAFVANLVLVRFLAPEEFGRFALVQANVGLVGTFFGLRLNQVLVRASEEELDQSGRDRFFSALAAETAVVAGGSTGVLMLTGLWDWRAAVLVLGTLIAIWINAQKALYERGFQYRTLGLLEGGSHLLSHLLAVLGVIAGVGSAVLYLRGGVQTLGQLGGLYYIRALQGFRLQALGPRDWMRIAHAVRGFWANGVLEQSFERLVILLVGGLIGERATGYFFQARRLAVTPHQLVQPVAVRVSFNYFSHRFSAGRRWSIFRLVLLVEVLSLLVIGLIAVLWADMIITLLFGQRWEPVVPIFQALGGVMVGMTPFNTIKAYCMAAGLMRSFIIYGMGVQYGALAVCTAMIIWFQVPLALAIAVALSSGLLMGGGLLMFVLWLRTGHDTAWSRREGNIGLKGET